MKKMEKVCSDIQWSRSGECWEDISADVRAFEKEDGKFIFADNNNAYTTSELIDIEDLYWDENEWYIYHGKPLDDFIIDEYHGEE
jgi:hypothetical protein